MICHFLETENPPLAKQQSDSSGWRLVGGVSGCVSQPLTITNPQKVHVY